MTDAERLAEIRTRQYFADPFADALFLLDQRTRAEKVIEAARKWAAGNRHMHLIDILAEYDRPSGREKEK
jgi:hypothetical protein